MRIGRTLLRNTEANVRFQHRISAWHAISSPPLIEPCANAIGPAPFHRKTAQRSPSRQPYHPRRLASKSPDPPEQPHSEGCRHGSAHRASSRSRSGENAGFGKLNRMKRSVFGSGSLTEIIMVVPQSAEGALLIPKMLKARLLSEVAEPRRNPEPTNWCPMTSRSNTKSQATPVL